MFSSTGRADHKLRSSSKLPPPPSGEWTYMRGKPKGISQGFAWNDPGQRIDFSFAGFRWHVSDGGKGRIPVTVGTITGDMIFFPSWLIVAPHWFGVLLFGTFPAIYLIRRKKRMPGTCKTCGYDLRATPERCPECGAVPVAAK